VREAEPLGTGGPLRLAADQGVLGERFLVLNGDVLTDLDLTALIRSHEANGATATLALYPVDDPTAYGLVRRAGGPEAPGAAPAAPDGEVLGFLEKPGAGEIDTNEISAGAYVMERRVLDLISPGRMVSIEREVFPRLVGDGLYGHALAGYWMDIGTPERYLRASWDILEGRVRTEAGARAGSDGLLVEEEGGVDPAATVSPAALLEAEVTVAAQATIGPRAVIARGSRVDERATVRESVALAGCAIGPEAEIRGAILGPGVRVGEGAQVGTDTVIGEGAQVAPGASVGGGARVDPRELVS
jgi:mannose-1-phosphate guanylyltransferase